ncbi:hypothetical protein BDZ90DRAFT_231747 [Jaminaea rosea]|uniref:Stress-response A/B barrel domain-containing protein n=1 Tax=Jaminaea rosea TaxID=1569628 RepID=A0A316URN1_9BASI|nr:hypothetical protein BDZ90DRAFT_231747 [Jaminaea rosea]PWN27969.1 hypothetical protein BDZ90DRAFT_231747 [Jaminaea rosea]
MPLIHIVLLKVKADIFEKGNGKDELVAKLDSLKELPIAKTNCQELSWGPPVYSERAKGWNYGLYTKFADKAAFEQYRDDEGHRSFVQTAITPNVDEVMAYDFEY